MRERECDFFLINESERRPTKTIEKGESLIKKEVNFFSKGNLLNFNKLMYFNNSNKSEKYFNFSFFFGEFFILFNEI